MSIEASSASGAVSRPPAAPSRSVTATDREGEPSPVGVAILKPPHLRVGYANSAHTALFGWRSGDLPTRHAAASGSGRGEPAALVLAAAATVLDTGEPVHLGEVAAGQRFWQIVCAPVHDGSTAFGVSVVSVDVTRQVWHRRQADDQRERLFMLDETTSAVTAEMDPRREFIALAESVVPSLADACAIYLIDQQPGSLAAPEPVHATRLVCVINPALQLPAPAPEARLRLAPTRTTAQAVRSGQPVVAAGLLPDPASWGEGWLTQLNPHSVVAVPMGTPGSTLAVIKFAAVGDRPRYRDTDIGLMRQITERVQVVVGHALRMQRTSEVALALQRGLLSDPPQVDGLEIAARYRPAGPGLEIGGDWYDARMLPAGPLGLTVGDVVGHDLQAASTMGQLRSMVQALACQPAAEPATVLAALDQLTTHLQVGEFATVVHGHLVPPQTPTGGGTFTWANAGHPRPLLLAPGRPVRVLDQAGGPLLGIPSATYRQASASIPRGATLLLYTDGLLEDPHRPEADTMANLVHTAEDHATVALDELCDRLIAAAPAQDDIALLAVRISS